MNPQVGTLELVPGVPSFDSTNSFMSCNFGIGITTCLPLVLPQDDLAFKLEYVHPYLDGVYYSRNRTLRVSCFNSRKLSPVFTGGPGVDEVPPIWVDRTGVKANITEVISLVLFKLNI